MKKGIPKTPPPLSPKLQALNWGVSKTLHLISMPHLMARPFCPWGNLDSVDLRPYWENQLLIMLSANEPWSERSVFRLESRSFAGISLAASVYWRPAVISVNRLEPEASPAVNIRPDYIIPISGKHVNTEHWGWSGIGFIKHPHPLAQFGSQWYREFFCENEFNQV